MGRAGAPMQVYEDALNFLENGMKTDLPMQSAFPGSVQQNAESSRPQHVSGFLPEIPREVGMVSRQAPSAPDLRGELRRPSEPLPIRSTSMPMLRPQGGGKGKVAQSSSLAKSPSSSGIGRQHTAAKTSGAHLGLVVDAAKARKEKEAVRATRGDVDEPVHANLAARALWRKAHVLTKLDTEMRKPRLRNDAPSWWAPVPERAVFAADLFDQMHRTRYARAERLYIESKRDGLVDEPLREAVFDVTSNRYHTNTPIKTTRGIRAVRERKENRDAKRIIGQFSGTSSSFDVYKSIWAGRSATSDSQSAPLSPVVQA